MQNAVKWPTAAEKRRNLIQYTIEIAEELSDSQIGTLHKTALVLRTHHIRKERHFNEGDTIELVFKKRTRPVEDWEISKD